MGQDTGYSAPFALQDILAQKRAVQHQKLVDSLNLVQEQATMENAAKQRDIQQQQLKDNAAYRAQEIAGQNADRASREMIAKLPQRQTQPGIVEEYQYAKNNGYKGSFSQYQTEDANRKRTASPAPNFTYAGTDPDTGRPFSGNGRTGGFVTTDDKGNVVPYLGKAGAKPSASAEGRKITASEANKGAGLRIKATPKPGFLSTVSGGMFGGDSPAGAGDVAAFNQWQNTTITNYPASPDVKDTVRDVLSKEDPTTSSDDIIKAHAGVFTGKDAEDFADLIASVRGQ